MGDEIKQESKVEEKKEFGKPNLKNVIEDAMVESAKQVGDQIQEEEKKEEKKEETPSKQEEELTAEQENFIKTLYKGLNNKDPKIQLGTLKILANAVGMDLTEIKTSKEAAKAEEETLSALLKSGLGEYDFLAEKLGPVLEKALDKYIDKKTSDIRETLKQEQETRARATIETEIQAAFSEFENAIGLKDDVYKLMNNFQPSKNISAKDYFRSLIVLAANEKNIELKQINSKQSSERVVKNRNDAMSRLASERNAEVKEASRIPQRMSLKESVTDAVEKTAELLSNKGNK